MTKNDIATGYKHSTSSGSGIFIPALFALLALYIKEMFLFLLLHINLSDYRLVN